MVAIGPPVTAVLQSAIDKTHLTPSAIEAYYKQARDRRIVYPIQSPCKTDNTNIKGVDRVLKNLLNEVEEVKKFTNLVSANASAIAETASYIQRLVSNASTQISGYVKNILGGARGWVMNKVQEQAKKVFPFLFPGETPAFTGLINNATNGLSCGFNKIVKGLAKTAGSLLNSLINKFINAPLCVAQNFVGDLLDGIMSQMNGILNSVLGPISSFIGNIAGAVSNVANSLFNVLDFATGILNFFRCDDDKACPSVQEVSLQGESVNNNQGGNVVGPNSSTQNTTPSDNNPTGGQYATGNANGSNNATEQLQTAIRPQTSESTTANDAFGASLDAERERQLQGIPADRSALELQ
jgi:hypothetical protein